MKINIDIEVDLEDLVEYVLVNYFDYDSQTKETFTKCIIDYINELGIDYSININPENIKLIASKVRELAIKRLTFE